MSLFGISNGVIIAVICLAILASVALKLGRHGVELLIFKHDANGVKKVNGVFLDLILLVVTVLLFYNQKGFTSYLHTNPFLATFVVIILLYLDFFVWYFKIQKKANQKKNINYFLIATFSYFATIIFIYTRQISVNFSIDIANLFFLCFVCYIIDLLAFYLQMNHPPKKTTITSTSTEGS